MSENIVSFRKNEPLDAMHVVETLASSPEYEHNKRYSVSRALSRTALELTGMQPDTEIEDEYEPTLTDINPEIARNAMVGALPSFVYGLEGIRHAKTGNDLSRSEFRAMKGRTAHFNHTVKAMIEQNTSLDFQNVTDTVTTLYGVMNRERWGDDRKGYEQEAKWFNGQFDASLRGMQQEVLARQVIQAINLIDPIIDPRTNRKQPRVTIDTNVSVEDDLSGADMFITLDGVTFPIDIKASERTAENVRQKSSHPKSIITTGFTSRELDGAFRVNTKLAKKAAPAMLEKLYAAREEFMQRHSTAQEDSSSTSHLAVAA